MITSADIFRASILIVDDRVANLLLLEQMLIHAGYSAITTTQHSSEVCALHRRNRYDLIMLDLQMPGMDGFQVMEELKEIEVGSYLPVLVVTAQPDHKLRALKAGAKDFVSKPFDLAEVLLRVYNLLEVRLLHQQLTIHNFERLENSQRIASLGDWEYDFARRSLVWSEGFYRLIGLTRQDTAPNAEVFARMIHPDDQDYVQEMTATGATGPCRVDYVHRIIRPDGEVRHLHKIVEISYDEEGRPVRETGTMQDVTGATLSAVALRDSEERFKFVARAVSDVVWDWNLVTNALWWNDGFLATFGFEKGELTPSVNSWITRIHPDDRTRVVDSMHQAIAAGGETWCGDYRFQRKDGVYVCVQDRGFILRNAAGQGIRMVGGIRDLTAQKKMESQYLRALRMESIGTLAGGISHDLNNVLTPIMLAIEVLKLDSHNDARRLKILDTIEVNSRRGADLVRQVLSFARGIDGQRVAVKLGPLITELVGIITETFPRNIRITSEVAADLWPVVGDPSQLHQVLLNLTVNARDAMPLGGGLALVASNIGVDEQYAGMSQNAKAGPHILLQITDTGSGIAPEVRDRIFEPFFTTKERGQGTGIGLATVDTIVKSHGGFVNVYTELGHGTTFKVYLPADPTLQVVAPAPALPGSMPRGRDELVLVIDDEPSIREITQQTLEAFGYRVIVAGDGAEAVALYAQRAGEVALVLTDMMMPIMDGAATIQVLRRINPGVKIIATSGVESGYNVAKASNAGANYFLLKPYTAQSLLKQMRRVLDAPGAAAAPEVRASLQPTLAGG
jgi:PAS domain S-box-containing protein